MFFCQNFFLADPQRELSSYPKAVASSTVKRSTGAEVWGVRKKRLRLNSQCPHELLYQLRHLVKYSKRKQPGCASGLIISVWLLLSRDRSFKSSLFLNVQCHHFSRWDEDPTRAKSTSSYSCRMTSTKLLGKHFTPKNGKKCQAWGNPSVTSCIFILVREKWAIQVFKDWIPVSWHSLEPM